MAVLQDKALHDRITLTLPVMNNARRVVFLARGSGKAASFKRVVEERDSALPASLVRPGAGRLFFLVESEAFRLLSRESYVARMS
jgi:6-phosphogluconolactonase